MSVDPRSLNYPTHDAPEGSTGAESAGLEPDNRPLSEERRSGTNDELKELDRVERRKQERR